MISREGLAQRAHDVFCANHRIISRLEERVRELDAAWLRHTWPCGHISEGTGDEPDCCRICVAEERARNAGALAANLRRVDNERAIELMRVKRDLATAQAALGAKDTALRSFHDAFMAFAHAAVEQHHEPFIPRNLAGLYEATVRAAQSTDHALLTTPTKGVPQWEKDIVFTEEATNNNALSPRDAVVEAAKDLFAFDRIESDSWGRELDKLRAAVHALRATEGRG